jgi:transcriptional regulator with XRE-family HTH domain
MHGSLPTKLRVLRAERGLTLRDAEDLTGVDKDTLSKIERGSRHPHDVTLAKIARGYGVPVENLLEPSLEWARTASDEEYSRWIETASAHDLHNVWVSLSRAADGMEENEELYTYAGRIQQAVDQYMRILGPPAGIRPRRSRGSDAQEDQQDRDVG